MGGEQGRLAPDDDICRCQERPEQVKSTGQGRWRLGAREAEGCGEYEKWCCRLWGPMRAFALCTLEIFQLRFTLGVSCNIEWEIQKQNIPAPWFLGVEFGDSQ